MRPFSAHFIFTSRSTLNKAAVDADKGVEEAGSDFSANEQQAVECLAGSHFQLEPEFELVALPSSVSYVAVVD